MAGTSMRSHMLRAALVLLNLALLILLAALWIDSKGQLRSIHWKKPETLSFEPAGMVPTLPMREIQQGAFLETLERPLFSPSRRPPPPPPPPAPAAEAAPPLTGVHVYGMYGAGKQGGAIVRVDGKNQRITVNEAVKGWRLVSVDDKGLTFRRGASQHVLELKHFIPSAGSQAATAAPPEPATRPNARSTTARARPVPARPVPARTVPAASEAEQSGQ